MNPTHRNIGLLAAAQSLLLANGITLVAINSLLGLQLAPDRHLATLPVTTYVIGGAVSTFAAAFFMKRYGRRAGFMLGGCFALVASLLGALAVAQGNFWLLCSATVLAGVYNAFGQQYRFAAADSVELDWKGKAISLTLAGGILGGVFGPELSKLTRSLLDPPFLASYLVLAIFAILSILIASRLTIPPLTIADQGQGGRPLREIARQPDVIIAVCAAVCGYATMNLLMTATPLAMDFCGLPFNDAAFVLQWHVISMFAPSFFTGDLIKRFGVRSILITGAVLMLVCTGIALSGVTLMHFWWALVLLGVGWNFLFIGGTTLLSTSCEPTERAKVQGTNDFIVLGTQAVTSLVAGVMIMGAGWHSLVYFALPMIALTALTTVLLWRRNQPD
jgi:MFS family permease